MSVTRITNRSTRIALAQYSNSPRLFSRGDRKHVSTFSDHEVVPHNGCGVDISRDELVKLLTEKEQLLLTNQEVLEEMKDKVPRTYADMENVKGLTVKQLAYDAPSQEMYRIESQDVNFAKSLLDVADNMGRASLLQRELFKIDPSSDTSGAVQQLKILLDGVGITEKQLSEVFKKFGLEKDDALDEEFTIQTGTTRCFSIQYFKTRNHVAVVLKAVYILHDIVVRLAEVGVTVAINNKEAEIGSQP